MKCLGFWSQRLRLLDEGLTVQSSGVGFSATFSGVHGLFWPGSVLTCRRKLTVTCTKNCDP